MALLSEKKLSNKLRIQLIEQIAEIDLPWFLFLEIDAALAMLNYFKLSNLERNKGLLVWYLEELSQEYNSSMEELSKRPMYHRAKHWDTSWFLTDYLISAWCNLTLSQQKLIWIESVYRVRCLLRMKEFINRRIYNEVTSSARFSSSLNQEKNW